MKVEEEGGQRVYVGIRYPDGAQAPDGHFAALSCGKKSTQTFETRVAYERASELINMESLKIHNEKR